MTDPNRQKSLREIEAPTIGGKRRDQGRLLRTAALLLTLLALAACGSSDRAERPNVVVVVVDTLRADHLTQYGYRRATSSALERLDAQATRFTAAYSTSSWTQPSVASLFTGLLPAGHGVLTQSTILPSQFDTLAGRLSEAGWQTAGFSGNLFVGEKTGFDRGFDHFEGHEGKVLVYPDIADMLERVARWFDGVRRPGPPSLLYFQPMNCHGPYRVPKEHRSDLLGRAPSDEFDYNDELMTAIMKGGDVAARGRVTETYLASLTDQYDTAVRYSMDAVGRLLDLLVREGQYENSLIVVTSDHGEELFDHGGFGHAYSLFEEVVRVPLWIKSPGQRRGATVEVPVSLVDLLPTILTLAGIETSGDPAELDGLSLQPLLESGGEAPGFRARPIAMDTRWRRRAVASAVRLGSYKLIEIESDYSGRSEVRLLYDLASDPGETTDLSLREPEKADALAAALERLRSGVPTPEADEADLDRDTLKALGYID